MVLLQIHISPVINVQDVRQFSLQALPCVGGCDDGIVVVRAQEPGRRARAASTEIMPERMVNSRVKYSMELLAISSHVQPEG
jgi:hypothetical protein